MFVGMGDVGMDSNVKHSGLNNLLSDSSSCRSLSATKGSLKLIS